MAQAWVNLIGLSDIEDHLDSLAHKLNEHPELWLPYQSIDDVLLRIREGEYQLWTGGFETEVVIWGLTELRFHPQTRTITIVWCSGEHGPAFYAEWISTLESFAKVMEIDRIIIESSRLGWQRIFEPHGFRLSAVELTKDLINGRETTIECNAD